MKSILLVLILLTSFLPAATTDMPEKVCLTDEEYKLGQLINEYRQKRGLEPVPLSGSLSYVAKVHSKDLQENQPHGGKCNMHSWSDKGDWTSCCYTNDHKQADCMWNKPLELTGYDADGYEISFFSSDTENMAAQALQGWKESPSHHSVIIQSGQWRRVEFKAMGIGIYGNYVNVWFSTKTDNVEICRE